MTLKAKPDFYKAADSELKQTLGTKELLALGIGMMVGASIFTLPGIVADAHTGPAIPLAFIFAAIVAGVVAFAYAEASSAMPYAGSAFTWMNVLFGEFTGWIVGWALLAEYFIAIAFVASGWSSYFQGFIGTIGFKLPAFLSSGFNPQTGGMVDLFAVLSILAVAILLSRGLKGATKVQTIIVILKVAVILLFVVVGLTAIHLSNYVPFIPKHKPGTTFGGATGLWAGTAQMFVAYIGFDALAANTAETKNPGKAMPRGIIGTLIVGTILFVAVSAVMVGMFKYTDYANNSEPAAWALRQAGHFFTADLLSIVAIVGMFTALISSLLACSRLVYSFGRDGMLPKPLGRINKKTNLPNVSLWVVTVLAVVVGGIFPFSFLSNLISAGTLIAFMFVCAGIYALRPREGKDIMEPKFKMPFYPILPAVGIILSFAVFWGLDYAAKWMMLIWILIGALIYFAYGIRHSEVSFAFKNGKMK